VGNYARNKKLEFSGSRICN